MKLWTLVAMLLAAGGCTTRNTDRNALPFELSREEQSRANWNTGGRTTWWEYTAEYRGEKIRFTAPSHDRRGSEAGPPETFEHCNNGYGLGKTQLVDQGENQRIAAEALLLNMGPDPNNAPRWFLLRERDGRLEPTWLASPGSDTDPVWQVWPADQPPQAPGGEEHIWRYDAARGVLPLRPYQVTMALPPDNTPRLLSITGSVLIDVPSLALFRLPEPPPGTRRDDPLTLSPDGDVLLFVTTRNDETHGIEQIAWKTGETRSLPLDFKARHLRNTLDITPAWLAASLAWEAEMSGGTRWAQWRDGIQYPLWTGRLRGATSGSSDYTLEGYRVGIVQPIVDILIKDLGATIDTEDRGYPLKPGEVEHRLVLDGVTLVIGYSDRHDVTVFTMGSSNRQHGHEVIARVAEKIDAALKAGQWQTFAEL